MKKVEAIIKPYLLDTVKEALQEQGFIGMTVSEIMDFGHPASGFRTSPAKNFSPRLKVEVVVADRDVGPAVDTIQRATLTNDSDDPLVIQEVEDVIRIRTAEHGERAI